MENQNKPEVTVAVITYNSSRTVLETLESIKAQTYERIRLIISDDCSTDNTIKVCEKWIKRNSTRFVSSDIIKVSVNTGIVCNTNRAWDSCQSDYLKMIAGDDYLMPDCIENNISFMLNKPSSVVVFSKMIFFGSKKGVKRYCSYFDDSFYSFFSLSVDEQHKRLVEVANCLPAPTSFFHISKVKELGLRFDERIPLMEDWPMWINLTERGIRMDFFDKDTVCYRVGRGGLTSDRRYVGDNFYKSLLYFRFYYQFDYAYIKDKESAVRSFVEEHVSFYHEMIRRVVKSPEYRVGRFLLSPWRFIQKLFSR